MKKYNQQFNLSSTSNIKYIPIDVLTPNDLDLIVNYNESEFNIKEILFWASKFGFGSHFASETMGDTSLLIPVSYFTSKNIEFGQWGTDYDNNKILNVKIKDKTLSERIDDEKKIDSDRTYEIIEIVKLKKNVSIFDHMSGYDISCCKNLMTCNIVDKRIDFILHKDTMKGKFRINSFNDPGFNRIQKYELRGFVLKNKALEDVSNQKIDDVHNFDVSENMCINKKTKLEKTSEEK